VTGNFSTSTDGGGGKRHRMMGASEQRMFLFTSSKEVVFLHPFAGWSVGLRRKLWMNIREISGKDKLWNRK